MPQGQNLISSTGLFIGTKWSNAFLLKINCVCHEEPDFFSICRTVLSTVLFVLVKWGCCKRRLCRLSHVTRMLGSMTHWLNIGLCLFTKIAITLCKIWWPICSRHGIVKLTIPLESRILRLQKSRYFSKSKNNCYLFLDLSVTFIFFYLLFWKSSVLY